MSGSVRLSRVCDLVPFLPNPDLLSGLENLDLDPTQKIDLNGSVCGLRISIRIQFSMGAVK